MRSIFLIAVVLISTLITNANYNNGKDTKEKVNWMTIEEALEANKKEPRKIIIDFYTDWCGWCKRMEKTTFNHPQIAKYINKNFYAVKFDAEGSKSIMYKDLEYKATKSKRPGRLGGTHEFADYMVFKRGGSGYPTIVFLDEESNWLNFVPSYLGPSDFDSVVKYIGDNHYKKTKWGIFQSTFKSRIKE